MKESRLLLSEYRLYLSESRNNFRESMKDLTKSIIYLRESKDTNDFKESPEGIEES